MKRIKFRAWDGAKKEVRKGAKGWHKVHGYIMQKAPYHPYANKRGYVPGHRLILENNLGRYLKPEEFVHHINQKRDDNRIENLQLQGGQNWHAKGHDTGKRNPHGQFLCKQPIFNEKKFRLLNKNTGLMTVYTLNKLISTTFRNGQFEYRGEFTGLKDRTGKEIYEGDITQEKRRDELITFIVKPKDWLGFTFEDSKGIYGHNEDEGYNLKVIGNLYEDPELLKGEAV